MNVILDKSGLVSSSGCRASLGENALVSAVGLGTALWSHAEMLYLI